MIDSQPSQDDKTIAILTHISGIFFSFVVPLVVWLISKDTKPWLTAESKEALNFQLTMLIGYLIAGVLTPFLIGIFIYPVVWILTLAFCIVAAVKTSQGGPAYVYPLTIRLIK